MDITVTITIEPSFQGTREYKVYWDDPENEYVMEVKKWSSNDRRGELKVHLKIILPNSEAHGVLWRLDRAELKVYPDGHWGCDGEIYWLEIKKDMSSVTYSWWCDLPEQWNALQEVIDFVRKHDATKGEAEYY